ncbi:seed biotin-containing protein SBP65-like [Rhodamnia argentea]|uniref:Seed biotin-containing protein SBP65-like n=1 Tax=Rhodamnia argentea TaxID=178133 RepID=A0A8B8N7W2_9MYRT|nr:seed biotin-containing protein SBP65-like [Rhodamnia argentea]
MASEQIHRRDHIDNNNNDVERDLVPKMTSHYESLAEKAKDPAITIVGGKDAPTETTAPKTEHDSPSKMADKRGGDGHGHGDTGGKVKEKVVQGAREGYEAVKETVAKAKDYTVEAGHKAAEVAAKPLVAAKDATAAVGDRAKEATAAKTEQMERERQGTWASEQRGTKTMDEILQEPAEYQDKENRAIVEAEVDRMRNQGKQGKLGGILGAIGETLVEIAQSTKDMVLGKDHRRGKPENAVVYDLGYGGKRPEHDAQGPEQ